MLSEKLSKQLYQIIISNYPEDMQVVNFFYGYKTKTKTLSWSFVENPEYEPGG